LEKEMSQALPFFATIPHSGEKVPDFCDWLKTLPETVLMCDVDRYVDLLYEAQLTAMKIPFVKTEWHRYAADLNRIPDDIDAASVEGSLVPAGVNNRGFHWSVTTKNDVLMPKPISKEVHEKLVKLIYEPFHQQVRDVYALFEKEKHKNIFHLDLHSMPSLGTKMHKDPGEYRAEIVVSDCSGKSSQKEFVDLVINSYVRAGFKVGYNWPYFGGRVSEQYGDPKNGHHCVQVELNRALYMDETTKKLRRDLLPNVQKKLATALSLIHGGISRL
jgi:N-formylglutamate amidohydrolase